MSIKNETPLKRMILATLASAGIGSVILAVFGRPLDTLTTTAIIFTTAANIGIMIWLDESLEGNNTTRDGGC